MKRFLSFIVLVTIVISSVLSCQQGLEEIRVSSISLSKSTLELTVGDQASLDATISPDNATNKKISWNSSKESVAKVTPDGIVEAVSAGTAFITARSEDSGVSVKCEITVKEKVISVTGIALNKTTLSLTEGDEFTLEPTVTPDNATNKEIRWTSDDEAVATVSAEGVVKALRAGKASITATTVDQGKSASCTVTVDEKIGAITGEATHISCRNAKISGNVTLPQTTSPYISFGVLYSTSSGVILGSATQLEAKDYDASYNFSIDTDVLEPETTYYYRSYVILNDEVSYGKIESFKTLAVSSMIQTHDASGVNPKDATLNAMLDLTDCKYNNFEYGFELTPDGGQAKTRIANNLADKAFSYRDETLSRNTGYYYVAYVKLDDILYKGETKTFTTVSIQASVTAEASDVQYHSAKISGSLTVQSEGSFSKSAVLYYSNTENTVEGLKSNGTRKTLTLGADGSYSAALSSLPSSTSYNYVVVAKVDDVELVTEVKSFKTLTIQASVTAETSDVQYYSATISSSLTVQSEGSFSKSAVLYYSSSESTLEGLKSNGLKKTLTFCPDGSYSAALSSLPSSTSYNFIVVAKVDDVELVTEVKSFKTLTIQASLTAEASDVQYHSATISGSLIVQSEGSFSKSAVLYYSSSESTFEGLKSNGLKKTLSLGADGSYSAALSSLPSSTSYNYVVVAKVDDVELETEVKSFKTLTIQASLIAEASEVQCNSVKISGSLTVQSDGSFSKSAVLYYSKTENTVEGLKSNGHKKTLTLGADGSYTAALSSMSSSTLYNFIVVAKVDDVEFASSIGNFTTPAPPEPSLVDLGLSVKWASCNLGASKPTECGGYYQWAGTKDVSDTSIYLNWDNCPYHTGSDQYSGWTKYNTKSSYGTVDNKTVLEAMDDAASVALGGKWRIPTDAEWSELRNKSNCSWTWTTIDGVNGYKVQSKKPGYTDNWIFLPAAGCRYRSNLNAVGSNGGYWSSSLYTDLPSRAYYMAFNSGYFDWLADCRSDGLSIRPVSE